jgi:hypothetical protein
MTATKGWKKGTFQPYRRSRAHLRMNRLGVYAGQSVATPSSTDADTRQGLETSPFPTLDHDRCPRCGWRVDQLGHEINCLRGGGRGRRLAEAPRRPSNQSPSISAIESR